MPLTAKKWIITHQTLQVLNADEDSFYSDGDEPYFVLIGFRAKLGVPGSAQAFWSGELNDKWAAGVEGGDSRAIPASMGRVEFADVVPVDLLAITQLIGKTKPETPRPEVCGVVSIAFESDKTPFSLIRSKINEAVDGIRVAVDQIIASNTTPFGKLSAETLRAQVADAAATLQNQIEPSIWGKLGFLLASAGDPDDIVGIKVSWFTSIMPEIVACMQKLVEQKNLKAGIPLPGDQSDEGLIQRSGLNPLRPLGLSVTYKASGVHYAVFGTVAQG